MMSLVEYCLKRNVFEKTKQTFDAPFFFFWNRIHKKFTDVECQMSRIETMMQLNFIRFKFNP